MRRSLKDWYVIVPHSIAFCILADGGLGYINVSAILFFMQKAQMKQKSINTEIWRDETFNSLSGEAKLLSIFLLTNHEMKLIPIYKISMMEIAMYTGMTRTKIEKLFDEIRKIGIIWVDGYCILKNQFHTLNHFKGEKLNKAIQKQFSEIPQKIIQIYKSDTLSIPYRYPIDRVNSNSNSNINIKKKEKEKINKKEKERKKELNEFIRKWNEKRKTKYKSIVGLIENWEYWRGYYSINEIQEAIDNIDNDEFWRNKMTPVIFLRRKNPRGENVDWIGYFLNIKKNKEPSKLAMYRDFTAIEDKKRNQIYKKIQKIAESKRF